MGYLKLIKPTEPAKQQADREARAVKIFDEEAREMSELEQDLINEELEKEQSYTIGQYTEDFDYTDDSATFWESVDFDIDYDDNDY